MKIDGSPEPHDDMLGNASKLFTSMMSSKFGKAFDSPKPAASQQPPLGDQLQKAAPPQKK